VDEDIAARIAEHRLDRRELLRVAAGLGLSLPAIDLLARTSSARAALLAPSASLAGGTLRFARNFEPLSLDPFGPADNGSIFARVQIFDTLVEARPNTKAAVSPALARSWRQSNGGKTWTFDLRPGVRFSNGDLLTAEDVVFSLRRFMDPKLNVNIPSLAFGFKSVRATGPRTIRIDLGSPVGALLTNISVFPASIISKKLFLKQGKKYFENPVATGPFVVDKWVRGSYLTMKRNPHYWDKGKPHLDAVRFDYIPDDNARMLKIRSGETDIAEGVPFKQITSLRGQSGFRVAVEPIVRYEGVFLNHRVAPLRDIRVRQALNYATDKVAINKAVYGGVGTVANDMIPRTTFHASTKQVPAYDYDLDRAKSLMEKAAPGGFSATFLYPAGSTVHQDLATILQAEWAQIGVKLSLQGVESGALFNRYLAKNWEIAVPLPQFTSDVNVPDEVATLFYDPSPGNAISGFVTGWKIPPKLWALTQQAARSTSDAQRERLWHSVQRIAMQQAPWVTLFFLPAVTAVSNDVVGFKTLPNAWWNLQFVSLKK
jgi:peptide/nickel transport system substrate-binding protein